MAMSQYDAVRTGLQGRCQIYKLDLTANPVTLNIAGNNAVIVNENLTPLRIAFNDDNVTLGDSPIGQIIVNSTFQYRGYFTKISYINTGSQAATLYVFDEESVVAPLPLPDQVTRLPLSGDPFSLVGGTAKELIMGPILYDRFVCSVCGVVCLPTNSSIGFSLNKVDSGGTGEYPIALPEYIKTSTAGEWFKFPITYSLLNSGESIVFSNPNLIVPVASQLWFGSN